MVVTRLGFLSKYTSHKDTSQRRVVREAHAELDELDQYREDRDDTDDDIKQARGAANPYHANIVPLEKSDGPGDDNS